MKRTTIGTFAVSALFALGARTASATPRPLPFTYTTETLGQGEMEVEQLADVTPVKGADGDNVTRAYLGTQFQTEFEYGITNRLELGLYVVDVPSPASYLRVAPMTETTGIKQRLRYTFADPGAWPVDVGVYGEVVEGESEVEFEAKVLLQRRFGKLRVDANLWAEYEIYYVDEKDVVLDPTLGVTYEIVPSFHVGAETWMRVEFPNPAVHPRPYALGPADYVGPAVLLNFGKLWASAGVYARVTDADHSMKAGEPYGPVWGRMIIGFEL